MNAAESRIFDLFSNYVRLPDIKLHSFLPQFTVITVVTAVNLFLLMYRNTSFQKTLPFGDCNRNSYKRFLMCDYSEHETHVPIHEKPPSQVLQALGDAVNMKSMFQSIRSLPHKYHTHWVRLLLGCDKATGHVEAVAPEIPVPSYIMARHMRLPLSLPSDGLSLSEVFCEYIRGHGGIGGITGTWGIQSTSGIMGHSVKYLRGHGEFKISQGSWGNWRYQGT
jgi:hypothetical protein